MTAQLAAFFLASAFHPGRCLSPLVTGYHLNT